MRRDLLITALLFTVVGFIGGYVYSQQRVSGPLPGVVSPRPSPGGTDFGLPEGHPPLDLAQRWRELQKQAEKNPEDPKGALDLASFLYDMERWEESLFWYRRALELDPGNAEARTELATAYFQLSRFEDALADYSRALELEPNRPQALYGMALVHLHGKTDWGEARRAFEQLRRSHPDYPGLERLARQLEEGRPGR